MTAGRQPRATVFPGRTAETAVQRHLFAAMKELETATRDLERQRGKLVADRRKPAGHRLSGSPEWYRRFFETGSDAILLMDVETGAVVDANATAVRLYGYTREEFLRLKAEDLSAEPEQTRLTLAARETRVAIRWHRKKDGTVFPVEVRGNYFSSGTREIHGAVICTLTEHRQAAEALRRADEKYRVIVENAAEGFFQSTPDGRLLAVNRSFAMIHGYASVEECMAAGQSIDRRFYSNPGRRAEWKRLLEARGEVRGFECPAQRKDGSLMWVSTNARVVRDVKGRIIRYEGLVQDISERKRVEQQLLASREQLRTLAARLRSVRENERARIAREIHDEMGHAFTDLKLDLAWLDRRLDEKRQPGQLIMRRRIAAMMKRVEDDLNTARRISTELRPAVLDTSGFAAAMEWEAKQFEERTGIECELDLPSEGLALDTSRSTAMFRVFQEILSNVARHAGATCVRARLRAEVGQAVLEVTDNGRGITAREMADASAVGLLGMR